MPIPDFQTIMLPLLRHLADGRARSRDLVEAMSSKFALDADERAMLLPSGRQPVIANRVNWAASYLYAARLLDRVARGVYELNERGRDVLAHPPHRITIQYLQRFPEFLSLRPNASLVEGEAPLLPSVSIAKSLTMAETVQATAATPDEQVDAAVKATETALRGELLQRVRAAPPRRFEDLVLDLLGKMGYGDTAAGARERLGGSGDGGVDGVIREDRLGLDVIYVQAKRYREDATVGPDKVREFAGALEDKGARKGVFLTTSRFTRDATEYASRQQQKRIVLIDGDRLTDLMLRYEVGVRVERTILLKRLDLDYFDPDDAL